MRTYGWRTFLSSSLVILNHKHANSYPMPWRISDRERDIAAERLGSKTIMSRYLFRCVLEIFIAQPMPWVFWLFALGAFLFLGSSFRFAMVVLYMAPLKWVTSTYSFYWYLLVPVTLSRVYVHQPFQAIGSFSWEHRNRHFYLKGQWDKGQNVCAYQDTEQSRGFISRSNMWLLSGRNLRRGVSKRCLLVLFECSNCPFQYQV